jgi:hypothetical protein
MDTALPYRGSLTAEQFMFYEMRIVSRLVSVQTLPEITHIKMIKQNFMNNRYNNLSLRPK